MCGINGILKKDGCVEEEEIRRMSSCITHRGPDEAGFMLSRDRRCGISNLRLSIMDIKNGQQPMYNEDYSVAIVFNGEVYDIKEHKKNLEAKGHIVKTNCDTEILVHMYEEYGMDFLNKINGEYAFIIWDERKKMMYAGRDCFGIKPLFYYTNGQELLMSSEIKAILSLNRVEKKVSPYYILSTFTTMYSQSDTLIRDVYAIKPGHYIEITPDCKIKEIQYWRPDFTQDNSISFEEAKEGVRHYFEKAVKRRLVADVPVAVYLSGGVDSTLVCGTMAKYQKDLKAFNIGFTEGMYDESSFARKTAEFYGVDFSSMKCSLDMMADKLEKTVYHTESVISNPHCIAKNMLSEFVHNNGYKVCMTGEGSDEFFAGYPYFKLEHIWRESLQKDADPVEIQKKLEAYYKAEQSSEFVMWDREGIDRDKNTFLNYPNYFYHRANGSYDLLRALFNREYFGDALDNSIEDIFNRNFDAPYIKSLTPLEASRYIALNQLYAYIIPFLGDRAEMANSVEARVPFLDREFVEFASKLPSEYLLNTIDGFKEKYVLRKAFDDMMPPHMKERKKHTFLSPGWHNLMDTKQGISLKEEYFCNRALRSNDVFNYENVRQVTLCREAFGDDDYRTKKLDTPTGMILSLQILDKLFIKSEIPKNDEFEMVNRMV